MLNRRSFPLQNKVVLITGAGSGIGAACARVFHNQGAYVILVDIIEDAIKKLADELGDNRVLVFKANVADQKQLETIVGKTVDRFGGIDVLFANAGIVCNPPTTFRHMEEKVFEHIIDVNLMGVVRTTRACLPQIVARKGHVLITASIFSFFNGIANTPYAISKAGVEMFGRSLRAELAGTGATAGILYPGWVNTPLIQNAFGGHAVLTRLVKNGYPGMLRRIITPQEVANATLKGIETRASRIFVPRHWGLLSAFRGMVILFLDWAIDQHRRTHNLVRELEKTPSLDRVLIEKQTDKGV